MNRRTFIKLSTIPIWFTVKSGLTNSIFALPQKIDEPNNCDVSVLNLSQITTKTTVSDYSNDHSIQLIGIGHHGSMIVNQSYMNCEDGLHNIHYQPTSDDIEEIVRYDPEPEDLVKYVIPVNWEYLGRGNLLEIGTKDFIKPDTTIFIGNLKSSKEIDLLVKNSESAQKMRIFTIGVVIAPTGSRQKERIKTSATLNKVEKSLDSLFIIYDDVESYSVKSSVQQAIGTITKWYLVSRPQQYNHLFDLTEIKKVLLEGRADFRQYHIPKTDEPIDFVKNKIVTDLANSKLKNGLIHFHSNDDYDFEYVNKMMDLICKQIDMNGHWCFYCSNDSNSETQTVISIVSTGRP
jgi:hypothetical protein